MNNATAATITTQGKERNFLVCLRARILRKKKVMSDELKAKSTWENDQINDQDPMPTCGGVRGASRGPSVIFYQPNREKSSVKQTNRK